MLSCGSWGIKTDALLVGKIYRLDKQGSGHQNKHAVYIIRREITCKNADNTHFLAND